MRAEEIMLVEPSAVTPGLGALRNVATLKCVLLRLPVQSVESRGFKMKSEFFFQKPYLLA